MASAETVLRAEGLCKAFGGQVVLDRASFRLQRGSVIVLRGANGSGKTTLLNILTGNLTPDAGRIILSANGRREQFVFPKPWWQRLNPLDHFAPEVVARQGIGRSWQDIRLFGTQNLRDNLRVAIPGGIGESPFPVLLRPLAVRREEERRTREADTMLAHLGLRGRETASADMVSLGQAKRVAIARAVQAGARVLFLDEPLAGLDAAGVASVIDLLRQLLRERELTLVLVEHALNLPRLLDLATEVWTLDLGRLRIESPDAVRDELASREASVDSVAPWLASLVPPGYRVHQHRTDPDVQWTRIAPDGEARDAVLEVENLVVRRGKRVVIGAGEPDAPGHGVSFQLRRGELLVLHAPNGWGKTTLLHAIAGLLPVSAGRIRVQGRSIERYGAWERRGLGVSLLQSREQVFPSLTVRETLQLAGASEALRAVNGLADKFGSDLSGGERQRIALAAAFGGAPVAAALLDEPFNALDAPGMEAAVRRLLDALPTAGLLLAVPATGQTGAAPGGAMWN